MKRSVETVAQVSALLKKLESTELLLAPLFWEGIRMSDDPKDFPEHLESGYLASLYTAFAAGLIKLQANQPLTLSLIKTLHGDSLKNVANIIERNHYEVSENDFILGNMFYTPFRQADLESHLSHLQFMSDCKTMLAKTEPFLLFKTYPSVKVTQYQSPFMLDYASLEYLHNPDNKNELADAPPLESTLYVRYRNHEPRINNVRIMTFILDKYQQAMEDDSQTDREKINHIVTMVQRLERFHPFSDGNCRTFCMLLLNLELLRHNLSPTIQNNPNFFDNLSTEALTNEIITGQERFQSLLQCPNNPACMAALEAMQFIDLQGKTHSVSPGWTRQLASLNLRDTLDAALILQAEEHSPSTVTAYKEALFAFKQKNQQETLPSPTIINNESPPSNP